MLFQFALYPALCRTLGIVRLVRISGVIAVLVLLVTPDIQHTSWSERNSYVVGVTLVVLIQICMSVVRSTELFGPRQRNSWAWGHGIIRMSSTLSKLCNVLRVLSHLFLHLVDFSLSFPTCAIDNVLLYIGNACETPRPIIGRIWRARQSLFVLGYNTTKSIP